MSDGRARRSIAAVLLALTLAPHVARAAEVPIEITSDDGHSYEVHRQTGESVMVSRYRGGPVREHVFGPVCATTPCTTTLLAGEHFLGLSRPGGPIVDGPPVLLTEPSRVTVSLHDRGDWRAVGWIVFFASMSVGIGLVVAGGAKCDAASYGACKHFNGEMTAGLVTMIAGPLVVALPLILQKDGVSFRVEPLVLPSVARREGDPAAPHAEGLALTATF